MYYHPDTDKTFNSHSQIRTWLNRVLPNVLDDPLLAAFDIYPVTTSPMPDVTADEIAEMTIVFQGGAWTQLWTVRERTEPERTQSAAVLPLLKKLKNEQINDWREAANETTFPYLGKHIRCDGLSKMDLLGAAMNIALTGALPANWPGGWKAVDNSVILISAPEDFAPLFAAFTAQGTANFNYAQQLKQQLADATTAEEVDAITW